MVETYCTPLKTFFAPGSVVDHTTGLQIMQGLPDNEYYNAAWGSGRKLGINSLQAEPQHYIVITDKNNLVCKIWEKEFSGKLMILRRGQLDTQNVLMFKLSKEAVSNVWWPLKATKKGSGKLTTALLVFMNSTLGIVHMLGERLETRGLWLEFKKGQLTELPLPDFRKINKKIMLQLFRENHLNEAISAPLPNIREYMAMMSGLEAEKGNYESAINEALKDQKTKHRAVLDKISIQMLKMLGCHTIPNRLYELVFEEIESLRRIMEAANRSSGTVRDRGSDVIKKSMINIRGSSKNISQNSRR